MQGDHTSDPTLLDTALPARQSSQGRWLIIGAGLEGLAVLGLVLAQTTATLWVVAVTAHLGAAAVLGLAGPAPRSRRALMAALALTLPLLGVPLAILALRLRGRGEIGQFFVAQTPVALPAAAADLSRLTDAVSPCEALLSGGPDERSATLAMITRRPDAAHVRLLRWAVARAEAEVAIESALALEDMTTRFEERVAICRAKLAATPDFDHALAVADVLAEAIHSGLADECLLGVLSVEARQCYGQAAAYAPERLPEFAARKAAFDPTSEIQFREART